MTTDDQWAAEQQRFAAHFYPGMTVLRNHAGITDSAQLRDYEYQVVDLRAATLPTYSTFDAEHLAGIHRHLFGDIYPFAGQIRDYPLSKDGSDFAHYRNIGDYLDAAAYDLRNSPDIRSRDPDRFAGAIADVFAHLNTAHPFREGNGRSTRLFITQAVAELSFFRIDLSGVSREQWIDASKHAHPEPGRFSPNPEPLVPIFRGALIDPNTRQVEQRSKAVDKTTEMGSRNSPGRWAEGSAAARLAGGAFPRGAGTGHGYQEPRAASRQQPPSRDTGRDAGR